MICTHAYMKLSHMNATLLLPKAPRRNHWSFSRTDLKEKKKKTYKEDLGSVCNNETRLIIIIIIKNFFPGVKKPRTGDEKGTRSCQNYDASGVVVKWQVAQICFSSGCLRPGKYCQTGLPCQLIQKMASPRSFFDRKVVAWEEIEGNLVTGLRRILEICKILQTER